ncbi:hypothetical protein [Arcticibacterium luteifluviistationis]|uniref:Secretion protein n=1 Tax=Arcticibacterium luteifluviistationis TaxID=1784714 RepID=A0A2Z4GA71_9BACT|nr:hypothetical protein [Arcticibacterium luteifluviistationis]AWV97813.1 hypothetical protein DJ013_06380 [Arcticibacterium luteifluviistationis]
MKKLILSAVMLIGLSTASIANDYIFATNFAKGDLTLKAMKNLKFKVAAFNLDAKSILELKDDSGVILYKTAVVNEDYVKVFDLSSLPDGSYKLVLTTGKESTVKPFEIKTETTRVVTNL